MYDELIKRLRERAAWINFPHHGEEYPTEDAMLMMQAADAIEELSKSIDDANEANIALYGALPKWIPVTERLPKGADKSGELCENVWLLFDDGNVYPGWMNGITEKVYYLDNYSDSLMTSPIGRVKMWQPRPEPPMEE